MKAPRPWNLVAELTYRCPLRCAYCSNPEGFAAVRDGLDAEGWSRVFREAAALGVVHAGLTGGEPTTRRDLPRIVAAAAESGLYVHLVTAGLPIDAAGLDVLHAAGLCSVQLSFQDVLAEPARRVAGADALERKLAFARAVRARGLPLVLNFVLHRENLGRVAQMISLGRSLGAQRVELANVQFHGAALRNRAALLPDREALARAAEAVADARREPGAPEIVFVRPDHWSERPRPCMGGWGRRTVVVDPSGLVLPCHAAAALPALEFHSVRERSLAECWHDAPGMNAFRGEEWMREPCRTCPERTRDFGGCRCQAWLLAGDPAATDPACVLSPHREAIERARAEAQTPPPLVLRGASPPSR